MTWTSGIVLVLIALLAGVGITTVGPGGVFLTAALFGITSLSSAAVAGTASATFVATGLVGAGAYVWSGELATRASWEAALALSGAGAVGALTGTLLNLQASDQLFGDLLGAFLVSTAGLVVCREHVSGRTGGIPGSSVLGSSVAGSSSSLRRGVLTAVGGGVGVLSGLLGVGGPVIAVPTLVSFGMPMLRAVAAFSMPALSLCLGRRGRVSPRSYISGFSSGHTSLVIQKGLLASVTPPPKNPWSYIPGIPPILRPPGRLARPQS